MRRHYMVHPDNEERLLKIPPDVVAAIKAEALNAAREAIPHDEECLSNRDDADERDCNCGWAQAVAAIDALREKP